MLQLHHGVYLQVIHGLCLHCAFSQYAAWCRGDLTHSTCILFCSGDECACMLFRSVIRICQSWQQAALRALYDYGALKALQT